MKRSLLVALVLGSIVLAPDVAGHPREYIGLVGDLLLLCDPLGLAVDVGGVCFTAGHAMPPPAGFVTFDAEDSLFNPVSGMLCIDKNLNAVCGDAGDFVAPFCGSITVFDNDATLGDIHIQLDGPLGGNPLTTTCGFISMATIGRVHHTP